MFNGTFQLQAPFCSAINTCITAISYESAVADLQSWASSLPQDSKVLITLPSTYLTGASYAIYEAISEEKVAFEESPVMFAKSGKNEVY